MRDDISDSIFGDAFGSKLCDLACSSFADSGRAACVEENEEAIKSVTLKRSEIEETKVSEVKCMQGPDSALTDSWSFPRAR